MSVESYQGAPYVGREVLKGKRTATVFGSSSPQQGSAAYEEAKALGALLAQRGYTVVNGGYWGTMAASAQGARQAGGEAYGVVVSGVFIERHHKGGANPFLNGAIDMGRSIIDRIGLLLESECFVVLPGQLGTLQELSCAWNDSWLSDFHGANPRPVFAWRSPWEELCNTTLKQLKVANPKVIDRIQFVDGVEELASKLPC